MRSYINEILIKLKRNKKVILLEKCGDVFVGLSGGGSNVIQCLIS